MPAALVISLSACAPSGLKSPLPQDGPTLDEIIAAGGVSIGSEIDASNPPRQLPNADGGLHGYTRDAWREIEILFPRLPNPTLLMYVFPHLSRDGAPVPGYSTAFPLYDRDHYALPGELD